jgi:hypothetical protein
MVKFELAWLFKDGFDEKVAEIWQQETKGSSSLEKWHNKIRTYEDISGGGQKT